MTFQPEPRHDFSPQELEGLELRLYEYNSGATGYHDGAGIGFVIRNDGGEVIGAVAGYTWGGISELRQVWVHEAHRGRGCARALMEAYVAEARRRGVRRMWVESFDFQAPGLYEKLGFRRVAELPGWPEGHVNVILCRELAGPDA